MNFDKNLKLSLTLSLLYNNIVSNFQTKTGDISSTNEEGDMLDILQERARNISTICKSLTPPLTTQLQRWKQALPIAPKLADHFYALHLKNMAKNIIYLPAQDVSWCLVPKVGHFY